MARTLLLAGMVCLAVPAFGAEAPKTAHELLVAHLQITDRDSPSWKALMADGQARSDFCARCHGPDGISIMPLVPNLAGQNPNYLLEQIELFVTGRRQDFIMTPLARQFSVQDKAALVFYYANLRPRPQFADPALARQGEVLYAQRCLVCHGADAHGSDKFARLAGQHPAYLARRLATFQEAAGPASPMTGIARTLSERQIQMLTAYLSTMP